MNANEVTRLVVEHEVLVPDMVRDDVVTAVTVKVLW